MNKLLSEIKNAGVDLDIINCVYVIDGRLINVEPLRIGKGAGELGEVDLPVIRLPNGNPFIPGSSLKGVLRATAELIARSEGLEVCEPSPSIESFNKCSLNAELLTKIYYALISGKSIDSNWFNKLVSDLERKYRGKVSNGVFNDIRGTFNNEGIEGVIKKYVPCPICQLFGNTSLASHIDVMDSIPERDIHVLSRTRVSLDRFRGAVTSRALFTYEYVPPGVKWRLKLIIRNIDLLNNGTKPKILRSLFSLLVYNEGLITIGGMRSVGLGYIKLLIDETKVIKYIIRDFRLIKEQEFKLKEVIKS